MSLLNMSRSYFRQIRPSFISLHTKATMPFAISAIRQTAALTHPYSNTSLSSRSLAYIHPITNIKSESKMITNNDYAIFFHNDTLLANGEKNLFIMPFSEVCKSHDIDIDEKDYFFLGELEGKNIFAVALNPINTDKCFSFMPARDALKIADIETSQLICRGKQLLHWNSSSLHCGHCGSQTQPSKTETAKICQPCDKVIYPTTSPVVIVLVERDGQLLLARSPHFAKDMYSALAGFVEAGESCEEAIHREVKEEVGIKVTDISYFGSQAWPFPNSLIMAFRAQYAEGDLQLDDNEIEDAQWFKVSELQQKSEKIFLPHECSISRHIIDSYINRVKV